MSNNVVRLQAGADFAVWCEVLLASNVASLADYDRGLVVDSSSTEVALED